MKSKSIKIILTVILILGIAGVTLIMLNHNKKEDKVLKECSPFVGGSFKLSFETNTKEKIESMNVCVACSPSSYPKLPIPKNKSKKFLGWYYDSKFTKKIEGDTTLNVESSPKYDKNNCMIGYNEITLYAKWDKE